MNDNTWSVNAMNSNPEFLPVAQSETKPVPEPTIIQPSSTNVSHLVDPASIPLPSFDDNLLNEWVNLPNEDQPYNVSTLVTSNLDETSTVNYDNVHSNQQTTQLGDDTSSIGSGQLDPDDLLSPSGIVPGVEIDATYFTPYSETIPGWEEYHKSIDETFIETNGSAPPQSHQQCDTSTSPPAAPALPLTANPAHTSSNAPISITSNLAPTARESPTAIMGDSPRALIATPNRSATTAQQEVSRPVEAYSAARPKASDQDGFETSCDRPRLNLVAPFQQSQSGSQGHREHSLTQLNTTIQVDSRVQVGHITESGSPTSILAGWNNLASPGSPTIRAPFQHTQLHTPIQATLLAQTSYLIQPTAPASSSPQLRFSMHQNIQAQETTLIGQSSHGAGNPLGGCWIVPGVAGELYYVEMQGNRPVLVYPTGFASSTGLPITAPNNHAPDNSEGLYIPTPPPVTSFKPRGNDTFDLAYWQGATLDPGPFCSPSTSTSAHRHSHGHPPAVASPTGAHNAGPSPAPENRHRKRRVPSEVDGNDGAVMILESSPKGKHARHGDD